MPTIKTTVYVDEADYRTLQALAAAGGRSAAELMREALHPRWTPKSGHQWTPENRPPQAS